MTRNLRTQLADLAEAWLRAARPDLSRERATDLISDWPLAEPWDEETTALVLSRFPAELVPVAGVHFLPGAVVSSDAKAIVDRAIAANPGGLLTAAALNAAKAKANVPTGCRFADKDGELWAELSDGALQYLGECEGPLLVLARGHVEREYGPLVEVTAQPTAEACCDDHGNICGVVEYRHAACCDDCPEFATAVQP